MMIKIRYFGALKETLGLAEEQLAWQGGTSDELLASLRQRDQQWNDGLSDKHVFRVVVNQQVIYQPVKLNEGDEVAILPPVTGG